MDGAAIHANADSNAMFRKPGQTVEKKLADGVKVRLMEMSKEKPAP